jgi:hypothetical protein
MDLDDARSVLEDLATERPADYGEAPEAARLILERLEYYKALELRLAAVPHPQLRDWVRNGGRRPW